MSEGVARKGQALRVYQILLVLALGWLAGRLPGLFAENETERRKLQGAMGFEQLADAPADPDAATVRLAADAATARLAADVASRVAADVADLTIQRLIAAGWAPPSAPQPAALAQSGPVPRETVIRIVSEAGPQRAPAPAWTLPPSMFDPERPAAVPAQALPTAVAAPDTRVADRAHATATLGYAALKQGDRQRAVALLTEAARLAPDASGAAQWVADVRQLTRRWSIAGYVLSRGGSGGDALAASPVLGGGQAGAAVGYTFNPLANTRVSVVGRVTAAAGANGGLDSETAEAALGLRVQPFRSVPVAVDVERRFALGTYSRNAWAARVSGGGAHEAQVAGRKLKLEGYGEAGVIGFDKAPAIYAGAQARGATPIATFGRVTLDAGAGAWASAQRDYGVTASRFDLGPSAQFQVKPWPFRAQVDYRFRAVGNAVPGSGPVITVAGEF